MAGKQAINAEAFKAYCQVLGLNWQEVVERKDEGKRMKDEMNNFHTSSLTLHPSQDWGEAPDVSIFYGRPKIGVKHLMYRFFTVGVKNWKLLSDGLHKKIVG